VRAAASSHRVAAANFPICLLIALLETLSLLPAALPSSGLAGLAAVSFVLALLGPFQIAMSNSLFQRTRSLQSLEPEARQRDRNRSL
jgi:hypothetical protein